MARTLDNAIRKPCIFITSGGRTGTLFLADLLRDLIPACDAFHEPDVLKEPLRQWLAVSLMYFDPVYLTLGRLSRFLCMRKLSIDRQRRLAPPDYAARAVARMRRRFVASLGGKIYAEANPQMWGLIDVLPAVFPNSTTLFFVRDGRQWVRSWLAFWGGRYGPRDIVGRLGLGRLSAKMFPEDPWHGAWDGFDLFEKQCWLWVATNRFAMDGLARNPHGRMWKYEDLFLGDDRYRNLRELMDFVTTFPDGTHVAYGSVDGALERRAHASQPERFPDWPDWSDRQVAQFQRICGPLMDELGYGQEPTWREMCERATP